MQDGKFWSSPYEDALDAVTGDTAPSFGMFCGTEVLSRSACLPMSKSDISPTGGVAGPPIAVDVEKEGEDVEAGEIFGSVEAVKTVSDLYMPVSAEILEKNPDQN